MMDKYAEIIERLEKATGRDRGVDVAIATAISPKSAGSWIDQDHPWCNDHPEDEEAGEFTSSIDASIALVERMLPGWRWSIGTELADDFKTTEYGGNVYPFEQPFPAEWDTYGYSQANASIAILLALFRALEAKEGT